MANTYAGRCEDTWAKENSKIGFPRLEAQVNMTHACPRMLEAAWEQEVAGRHGISIANYSVGKSQLQRYITVCFTIILIRSLVRLSHPVVLQHTLAAVHEMSEN